MSQGNHRKMIVWQNYDKLDLMVQKILEKLPKYQYKLKAQIDSASDSVGANFVEGFYSGSIKEYLRFLSYAKRSLGELSERVNRLYRKSYLNKNELNEYESLAIPTMYLFDRLINSLVEKLLNK